MRAAAAFAVALLSASRTFGWDAHGHRTITYLALDGLPADAPAWLRDPNIRDRIAFQASEVDRWRDTKNAAVKHTNPPDHYLDVDLLDQFGLTLETVPPLRNEYLRAMMIAKHEHPDKIDPYDAAADPDRAKEWPGFALHAISEHYGRLQAVFMQVRILERMNDPNRAFQLEQARANAIYHMGMLSHFVGDTAQPLHTTRHYNGWVGANPDGYTTAKTFHAFIDGGVLRHHGLNYDAIKPLVKYEILVNRADPWKDVLAYIRRSHDRFVPLYRLDRDGELKQAAGKQFISECLADGAAMLAAMYSAAWTGSAPDEKQYANFAFFDDLNPATLPGRQPAASQPTTQPAAAATPISAP